MLSTTDLAEWSKWIGIGTLGFAGLTILAFILKWGIRFRLVGVTAFMGVLTTGVFALSLGLFYHVTIPGAVHYTQVYDDGGRQIVVTVPPEITETQLDATLRQALGDLYSPGRGGQSKEPLTIRARVIAHPQPGVSQPIYVGEVKRSILQEDAEVHLFPERLAQLQKINNL